MALVERARSPGVLAEKTDSSSYYDSRLSLCSRPIRRSYTCVRLRSALLFHHYNKPSPTSYINRNTQTSATQRPSPCPSLPFHNGSLSRPSFSRSPSSLPRHVRLDTNVYPRIQLTSFHRESSVTWDMEHPSLDERLIAGCASYQALSRYLTGADLVFYPRTRRELENVL